MEQKDFQDFTDKVKQETNAAIETKTAEVKAEMQRMAENRASKQELESLSKSFDDYKAIVEKQAQEITMLKNPANNQPVEFKHLVKKSLQEKKAELEQISKTGSGEVVIKAAELIDTGNFGSGVIQGYREPGINSYPTAQRFITNLVSTMNGGTGSNPLTWVNRVPKEGVAAWTAESNAKPIKDWTYTQGTASAEYLAVYSIVTRQAIANMPMLENEINEVLMQELYSKLDKTILRSGDGVSPNINGIWSNYAKDFTAGGLANSIPKANIADVLRVAVGQVRKGDTQNEDGTGFSPNGIVISEDMATALDILKDNMGGYITPYWLLQAAPSLKGIPIFATKYLADDEFVVGDFKKYLLNIVEGLTIRIGYINAQLINNQYTVLLETMAAGRVKLHDTFAFVKGSFSTATTALKQAE